jgi:hypothetical protein
MHLTVALPNRDPSGLDQFLKSVSTPGSPEYDHFLTLGQFDQRYGSDPSVLNAVENYLTANGLVVTQVYPGGLVIDVNGSAQAVDAAFNTNIGWYKVPDGRTIYSPASTPEIPLTLRGDIVGVNGFSNFVKLEADWAWGQSSYEMGVQQQFFAPDLQVPNGLPGVYGTKYGTGETIATILWDGQRCKSFGLLSTTCSTWGGEVGPFNPAWVTGYWSAYLPAGEPKPTIAGVPVDGAQVPGASAQYDGSQAYAESSLDVEMAGSMAPGADITEVYTTCDPTSSGPSGPTIAQIDDAFTTAVTNPGSLSSLDNVTVISNSWGAPEYSNPGGYYVYDATWKTTLTQALATGITVLVSSGDSGNNSVNWPADIGNDTYGMVSVGGVTLNVTGTVATKGLSVATIPILGGMDGIFTLPSSNAGSSVTGIHSQNAWWFPASSTLGYAMGGTTGGPSEYYSEPSWQSYALAGNSQNPSPWRGDADIAGVANNTLVEMGTYGVSGALINATDLLSIAGTSVASPEDAGVLAVVSGALGHRLGFIDPTLYSLGYNQTKGSLASNPFNDVTSGKNGNYPAQVGWDYPTGWGTLNASGLVANMGNMVSTLTSVSLSPSTPTVGTSTGTLFTATPMCTSTYPSGTTYTWALSSTTLGTLSGSGATDTFNSGTVAGTVGLFVNATLSGVTKGTFAIITVTSNPVTLSSVALSPTVPTVGTSGSQLFTATPSCSATCPGNIAYAWALSSTTLGTISGSGNSDTFKAGVTTGTVGIFVNATLSGSTKEAFTEITVSPITLTSVSVAPSGPTVTAGGQQLFTATATCTSTCPGTISYAWALSSTGLGTLSGTGSTDTFKAGTTGGTVGIFVNATLSGSMLGDSTVITVTVPLNTLTSLSLSPTAPSVGAGKTQGFTATPVCTSTCPASGIVYTWMLTSLSLGSISGTGASVTFTASTNAVTGGIFVNATLNGSTAGSFTVITVTAAVITLTSVTLSPTTPAVASSSKTLFTATPQCSSSCPGTGITYSWAISSKALGTLSGSGTTDTFTAGTTAGTVGIFVNATLSGTSKEGSTTITVSAPSVPVLTGVTISPTSANVVVGGSQPFSATPTCKYGSCPGSVTYVWTVNNTLGVVSSSSGSSTTYLAGNMAGAVSVTVNATLNGASFQASAGISIAPSGGGTGGGGSKSSGIPLWIPIVVIAAVVVAVIVAILLRRRIKPEETQEATAQPGSWNQPQQYQGTEYGGQQPGQAPDQSWQEGSQPTYDPGMQTPPQDPPA